VILGSLDSILSAGGAAFLEVGAGQAPAVCQLARPLGFHAEIHRDLAGIERVVELTRAEAVR
jgi:methylase of polypeptide subunit release factors